MVKDGQGSANSTHAQQIKDEEHHCSLICTTKLLAKLKEPPSVKTNQVGQDKYVNNCIVNQSAIGIISRQKMEPQRNNFGYNSSNNKAFVGNVPIRRQLDFVLNDTPAVIDTPLTVNSGREPDASKNIRMVDSKSSSVKVQDKNYESLTEKCLSMLNREKNRIVKEINKEIKENVRPTTLHLASLRVLATSPTCEDIIKLKDDEKMCHEAERNGIVDKRRGNRPVKYNRVKETHMLEEKSSPNTDLFYPEWKTVELKENSEMKDNSSQFSQKLETSDKIYGKSLSTNFDLEKSSVGQVCGNNKKDENLKANHEVASAFIDLESNNKELNILNENRNCLNVNSVKDNQSSSVNNKDNFHSEIKQKLENYYIIKQVLNDKDLQNSPPNQEDFTDKETSHSCEWIKETQSSMIQKRLYKNKRIEVCRICGCKRTTCINSTNVSPLLTPNSGSNVSLLTTEGSKINFNETEQQKGNLENNQDELKWDEDKNFVQESSVDSSQNQCASNDFTTNWDVNPEVILPQKKEDEIFMGYNSTSISQNAESTNKEVTESRNVSTSDSLNTEDPTSLEQGILEKHENSSENPSQETKDSQVINLTNSVSSENNVDRSMATITFRRADIEMTIQCNNFAEANIVALLNGVTTFLNKSN